MNTLKQTFEQAKLAQGYAIELAALVAEQKRVFFMSCINEGFTEAQALELTKGYPV